MAIFDSKVSVWRVRYYGVLEDGSDEGMHTLYVEADGPAGALAAIQAIDDSAGIESIRKIRVVQVDWVARPHQNEKPT